MFNFDKAGRYLIRLDPMGFYTRLCVKFIRAWRFRGWLDTSAMAFPGEQGRICDTVAEFSHRRDRRRRSLLVIEVQSHPHTDMPERLGEYAFQLRRQRRYARGRHGKYQVIGAVLNLTGAVQPHVLDMTEATLDGAGLSITVLQRTLREEDAAATLRRIAAGELSRCVLPWIPLMRGGGDAAIIEEWRRLASLERNASRRADFGAIALIFAGLAKRKSAWQTGLEGWSVRDSTLIASWIKDGELKAQRKTLLRLLQLRLQTTLPHDLVETVNDCEDMNDLERWIDLSATANSLTEFRANAGI
jgi:hypothetical protein